MQLMLRMISAAGFADADLGLPEVPTVTEIYIPSAFVLWIRICESLGCRYSGTWRHTTWRHVWVGSQVSPRHAYLRMKLSDPE